MQYRVDERTGNKLSVLGFGCMRLPGTLGRIDLAKSEELIVRAVEAGVNYFDTAFLYPGSEEALGQIVEKRQLRDRVLLATKLPHMMCKTAADFDKFFDGQKKRLRTDHIDYYLIHNVSAWSQWERLRDLGIEDWIRQKKASGEIRAIGFSFHGPKGDFAPLLESFDWDFCQIQYNYVNTDYQAGRDGLRAAAAKGMPVFIMEPLLGGKLVTGLPKRAEELFRAAKPGLSNAGWGLRWLWNQPEVTVVLSGMNALAQLDDNVALADQATVGMLSAAEIATVDQVVGIFRESYKVPCTGCNYCMPCPKGINIPACFTAYNTSFTVGRMAGMNAYIVSSGAFSRTPRFASSCAQCGKCESHCPQHIAIRDSLADVSRRLEPVYLKPVFALISRFMR